MRRKNDVSTLRYARSFERLQLRTSVFKSRDSINEKGDGSYQSFIFIEQHGLIILDAAKLLEILHYENMPIQYTVIFSGQKSIIFRGKLLIFFLFLLKT